MGVQALLQVGLGLLGVSALIEALTLAIVSGFGSMANLPPGGRGIVALLWVLLGVLALFAAGYALILHNNRIARILLARCGIVDAAVPGVPDIRSILVGLFGVSLLVRALPVAIGAIGTALNLRPQVMYPVVSYPLQQIIAMALQVGLGTYLVLRPARVLELWTPGHGERTA